MQALYFDIKHFAIHDGPGIRTTLFLKGCNLGCRWCQNPESISSEPEVFFYEERCLACRACAEACPRGAHRLTERGHLFDRSNCEACFACVEACPAGALQRCGVEGDLDSVERALLEDEPFYRTSGGGVTFSGGEPLLQIDFTVALAERLRSRGVHVAMDTAGSVPAADFERAVRTADLVLYDLKAGTEALHRRLTGGPLGPILTNLGALDESGCPYRLRIPIVPGLNDGPENLEALRGMVAGLTSVEKVELVPFHQYGSHKYARLGRRYESADIRPPGGERMAELRLFLVEQSRPAR